MGVRARTRRLFRCLFFLCSFLRKAARTALGCGKLYCACFGLALGRKLRLGYRPGLLLGARAACRSLGRLRISLCTPTRLLGGKLLGLRPLARCSFLFPLCLRATFRRQGKRGLRRLALLRQRRRFPFQARTVVCRRQGLELSGFARLRLLVQLPLDFQPRRMSLGRGPFRARARQRLLGQSALRGRSHLALRKQLRLLLRARAGGAFGIRLRPGTGRRGLLGLRFGQLARLDARIQLRFHLDAHARSLRQRLISGRTRLRLGQALCFRIHARPRRLFCSLFCLYPFLCQAARAALGFGEFPGKRFGLALGREPRFGCCPRFPLCRHAPRRCVIRAHRFLAPPRDLLHQGLLQRDALSSLGPDLNLSFPPLRLIRLSLLLSTNSRLELCRSLDFHQRSLLRYCERFSLFVRAIFCRIAQTALGLFAPPCLGQRLALQPRFSRANFFVHAAKRLLW